MIHNNLLHYYDTLKNKDLTTSELRYIIRTVISSQALYYLNVTPLTDVELATLYNKMALLWKRSIGTISGASPPMFLPIRLQLSKPGESQEITTYTSSTSDPKLSWHRP